MRNLFVRAFTVLVLLTAVWAYPASAPADQIVTPAKINKPGGQIPSLAPVPHIDSVVVHCFSGPCSEFDIFGAHFGATKGTRRVLINGLEPNMVHLWSDTKITVEGAVCTVWNQTYHFGVYNGASLLSNDFSKMFGGRVDGFSPISGPPGTKVTLHGLGVGATSAGKSAKMGPMTASIVSWTGSDCAATIVLSVPSMAAGSYIIDIYSGGTKIASCSYFKVT